MKKKETDELGIFNVILIGKNPHAISIADNIKSKFLSDDVSNQLKFNIVDDIERDIKSNSWFNEFIFDLTTMSKYNNIVISEGFHDWMKDANEMEMMYMKKLVQAMNAVIVDISDEEYMPFNDDVPQFKFNIQTDFMDDLVKNIDEQLGKLQPKIANIRLVKSLGGKTIPYLGDVFGCLSRNKYKEIITTDVMRFDVPILFDEFCKLSKGRTMEELDECIITRTNSALSMFFK